VAGRSITFLAVLCLPLAGFLVGPPALAADGEAAPTDPGQERPPACFAPSTAGDYLVHGYPRRLRDTAKGSFSGLSLLALALAGATVPWLDDYDGEVRSEVLEHRPPQGVIEAGEVVGLPAVLFGTSLAVAAAGCLADSREVIGTGATMLEALSVAGASTFALKLGVHRRRPDGSDHLSFPSNHASGSFAMASVLAGRHGWGLGIPAFLLAGFTSWARLAADKHYLTDTLFGAALGTAVGLAAVQNEKQPTARASSNLALVHRPDRSMAVVPIVLTDGGGVALAARW
jgi:hypothetical protein